MTVKVRYGTLRAVAGLELDGSGTTPSLSNSIWSNLSPHVPDEDILHYSLLALHTSFGTVAHRDLHVEGEGMRPDFGSTEAFSIWKGIITCQRVCGASTTVRSVDQCRVVVKDVSCFFIC